MTARRRRLVDAGRAGADGRRRSTTATSSTTTPTRAPTRARAASPTACTSSRGGTATTYEWGDAAWTGRQLAGSVDLRAARRHLHARGHPRRRDRAARPPRRPRRRPRRADAGQRLQRHPQLGLRRRRLVRRRTSSYGGPDAYRASSTPATPRASAWSRTSSTTTSARRATTSRSSAPTSRTAATPGATWSTSTARARPRCAATSSTTCGCGSRTTTSTGCGSTPCTRCSDTSRGPPPRGDGGRDRRAARPTCAAR